MINELFEKSTPLFGPYRLQRMDLDQVPATASVMLASEPWQSYGFSFETIERFLDGCVNAGIARVIICRNGPDEEVGDFSAEGTGTVEEQVVGLAVVQPGFLGGRFLEILAVAENHRGKGVGTKIIDLVCKECPPHIRDLFVLVAMSNTAAVKFYDKMGFIDVGEMPGLILPGKVERLIWLRFRD